VVGAGSLTIPIWAPMFASKEEIQGGHPQQGVGKIKTCGCYYSNARLLYTAHPGQEAVGV